LLIIGFIDSYAMEQADADGNLTIITVAIWQNAEYVKDGKKFNGGRAYKIEF
jgi:hypothetical protein